MPNKNLLKFIKEARARGFEDYQIREPLIKKGWPEQEVNSAFLLIHQNKLEKNKPKIPISIFLDQEILKIIEKRAKKNLLNNGEQIQDIIRRSCVNQKNKKPSEEKLDDLLVSLFSRKRRGK